MAEPKKRSTRSRGGMRRAHQALKPSSPSLCGHCKQPKAPHRVCGSCGHYAGVEIFAAED